MSSNLIEPFAAFGISDISVETDPNAAVDRITSLFDQSVEQLTSSFRGFTAGDDPSDMATATYPYIGIRIDAKDLIWDGRLAYGVFHDPGIYGTTLTRPQLFRSYFVKQIGLLVERHKVPIIVGRSARPIPLSFVVDVGTSGIDPERAAELVHRFPIPDLSRTDDHIANGTWRASETEPRPLALFTAERVDYSLHRLHHYTGTSLRHFQRYILLTNYQRYVEHFVDYARREIRDGDSYERFVSPGNVIEPNKKLLDDTPTGSEPDHLPQMPAYHLARADGLGVTMVNIGVGPSNARTITDHLAVLRPHCWLMLGHCAGLRRSQQLGDYVLAHGYVREDQVLDQEVPLFVPVAPIAEVQVALQQAVQNITGLAGAEMKTRMRTGTVATTSNRNWELRYFELFERLNQSRAIAVDMESATIATNGLRFRVPYGTLLCVSDKPLHGEIKLRGMANRFYQERINQHLEIGLEAIRILREDGPDHLHSRKLRSFDEPAFR